MMGKEANWKTSAGAKQRMTTIRGREDLVSVNLLIYLILSVLISTSELLHTFMIHPNYVIEFEHCKHVNSDMKDLPNWGHMMQNLTSLRWLYEYLQRDVTQYGKTRSCNFII